MQFTYKGNTEARSQNNCYHEKNKNNYTVCVYVWVYVCNFSYTVRKAYAPYYIFICGLSGSTILPPHYHIKGTTFG